MYNRKIDGASDRCLVIDKYNEMNKKNIKLFNKLYISIINKIKYSRNNAIFDYNIIKITDWNKFKFNSDLDMPIDTLINFNSLTIVFSHVVEKDNKFIAEIYVDQGIFEEVQYKMTQIYLDSCSYNYKKMSDVKNNKSSKNKISEIKKLSIDGTLWAKPTEVVLLDDIDLNKLSTNGKYISKYDLIDYTIKYYGGGFSLSINDIEGYFDFNNNIGF